MKKICLCFIFSLFLAAIAFASDDSPTDGGYKSQLEKIPWAELGGTFKCLEEAYPCHKNFSFLSSMGCSDITCTNPEHTHWCPTGVCQDWTHHHSAAEYARAAAYPTCPCHKNMTADLRLKMAATYEAEQVAE